MLKLDHVGPSEAFKLTIDEHVPLTLETVGKAGNLVYWRAKHRHRSLLEVALEQGGKLRSMTLVSIDCSRLSTVQNSSWNVQRSEAGLPHFDVSAWENIDTNFDNRFIDEEIELGLALGEKSARLQLGDGRRATRIVHADRFELLFDSMGYFVAMELRELNVDEIRRLRSSCG